MFHIEEKQVISSNSRGVKLCTIELLQLLNNAIAGAQV